MNLAAIRNHALNWREWELNAIVIKELRQGVRSWTVTGMLLLFLVVLFIVSLGFLVFSSFDTNPDMQLGGNMFTWFLGVLTFASSFFIPLLLGARVAYERQESNQDLLYVSTLTPFQIILGKFLCGAYTTVLFFSACMPFMAFTNLLRGVDLPTVFFILFYLFLVVCGANMISIFLACLPVSRAFKFLFLIYGIFQACSVTGFAQAANYNLLRSGVGAMMAQKEFWQANAAILGIILFIIGLFFVLSVALISPPSANRALIPRLYLTGIWLVSGIGMAWLAIDKREAIILYAWFIPSFIILGCALLVVISNQDQLSTRVRRTIPRHPLKRFLAFPFYNGAAGGLLWIFGLFFATLCLQGLVDDLIPRRVPRLSNPEDQMNFLRSMAVTSLYALDYCLLGRWLQRRFFPQRPAKLAGLLSVLLAGGWALAPSIFLFFANRLSWKSVDGFQPGNIFNVFTLNTAAYSWVHGWVALTALVLLLMLNARWLLNQWRAFVPPTPAPATEPPAAA